MAATLFLHPYCINSTKLQCIYDIKLCAAQGGHWSGMVEVEAHVVNIRNAVAADDEGLLKPLLKRWQDEACSQMVFGLPAVRAVINFKWDR